MRALLLTACVLAVACAAPSPTTVATATALATPRVTATSSAAPRAIPSAAPTVVVPSPSPDPRGGVIRNDGQKIIALPEGLAWSIGEGSSSIATDIGNYTLNGASLAGSSLRCTRPGPGSCNGIEIIPSITLRNGVTYDLALAGMPLGQFVAQGIVSATPHVVTMKATQSALTVTFDRPMLHAGDCGTHSWSLQTPGTMEYVRAAASGFPAALGAYMTTDAGYRDFFSAFVSQADLSADCKSVTLGSGWGAPVGTFDVTVSGVKDMDGNLVTPRTFSVSIADESPPKLMFAQVELQTAEKKVIRVAYSEAMDEEYVTDPERYYLNGKPIPAGTAIECALASCTWVRLTFAPSAFGYGSSNTLTIVGVRDTAGNAMTPDIVTSASFQVF